MRSAGIEQKCDPNTGAYLSIILEHEMRLERSIKAIRHKERAAFDFEVSVFIGEEFSSIVLS